MKPSSTEAGGERKTSTSEDRANWGILVSSFVATTTVLDSSGSICIRFHKKSSSLLTYSVIPFWLQDNCIFGIGDHCGNWKSINKGVHTCITTLLVVALLQSLQSSRHNMMNSLCCILALTRDSTARACACNPQSRFSKFLAQVSRIIQRLKQMA